MVKSTLCKVQTQNLDPSYKKRIGRACSTILAQQLKKTYVNARVRKNQQKSRWDKN